MGPAVVENEREPCLWRCDAVSHWRVDEMAREERATLEALSNLVRVSAIRQGREEGNPDGRRGWQLFDRPMSRSRRRNSATAHWRDQPVRQRSDYSRSGWQAHDHGRTLGQPCRSQRVRRDRLHLSADRRSAILEDFIEDAERANALLVHDHPASALPCSIPRSARNPRTPRRRPGGWEYCSTSSSESLPRIDALQHQQDALRMLASTTRWPNGGGTLDRDRGLRRNLGDGDVLLDLLGLDDSTIRSSTGNSGR